MLRSFLNFDKVLSSIYEETSDSEIDPVIYVSKYCELLKNEVDLFENVEISNGKVNSCRYLNLINQIEQFETKCVQNCRQNCKILEPKLKKILEDVLELSKLSKTKETIEKAYEIRKESTSLRREMFKDNLIFIDRLGNRKIGSLIYIEPFCLDDFQVECIK